VSHVLLIDNYDSFTFNLVQAFLSQGAAVTVRRNDAITVREARDLGPTHVVISPGPGRPEDSGVTIPLLLDQIPRVPVLGVCLGHQALAAALGGTVGPARRLCHGKASAVYHDARSIYQGLRNPFQAGRYHSLAVAEDGLPDELSITSYTSDGEIMGLAHGTYPAFGVQFHPESVLTPDGQRLLANFLDMGPGEKP
jgi:anthranilate synthase/aminodeoxychorismate synthase-like glutamine amidotransferase